MSVYLSSKSNAFSQGFQTGTQMRLQRKQAERDELLFQQQQEDRRNAKRDEEAMRVVNALMPEVMDDNGRVSMQKMENLFRTDPVLTQRIQEFSESTHGMRGRLGIAQHPDGGALPYLEFENGTSEPLFKLGNQPEDPVPSMDPETAMKLGIRGLMMRDPRLAEAVMQGRKAKATSRRGRELFEAVDDFNNAERAPSAAPPVAPSLSSAGGAGSGIAARDPEAAPVSSETPGPVDIFASDAPRPDALSPALEAAGPAIRPTGELRTQEARRGAEARRALVDSTNRALDADLFPGPSAGNVTLRDVGRAASTAAENVGDAVRKNHEGLVGTVVNHAEAVRGGVRAARGFLGIADREKPETEAEAAKFVAETQQAPEPDAMPAPTNPKPIAKTEAPETRRPVPEGKAGQGERLLRERGPSQGEMRRGNNTPRDTSRIRKALGSMIDAGDITGQQAIDLMKSVTEPDLTLHNAGPEVWVMNSKGDIVKRHTTRPTYTERIDMAKVKNEGVEAQAEAQAEQAEAERKGRKQIKDRLLGTFSSKEGRSKREMLGLVDDLFTRTGASATTPGFEATALNAMGMREHWLERGWLPDRSRSQWNSLAPFVVASSLGFGDKEFGKAREAVTNAVDSVRSAVADKGLRVNDQFVAEAMAGAAGLGVDPREFGRYAAAALEVFSPEEKAMIRENGAHGLAKMVTDVAREAQRTNGR